MAASIPWNELRRANRKPLRVLDPMAGSGTTLVVARALGHRSIGFDTDPLASLLAKVWCADIDEAAVQRQAEQVIQSAERRSKRMAFRDAYPNGADEETREFVRYWFDPTNRRQLAALATAIEGVHRTSTRDVLWCAYSRLIITKQAGASRALDVSHSRPHRTADKNTVRPFDQFLRAVRIVLTAMPFRNTDVRRPQAIVKIADARALPLEDASIDVVISSPPYLNAIDYLRGHKFSLVWMGHAIGGIRRLRTGNIGTEAAGADAAEPSIKRVISRMGKVEQLTPHDQSLLARYVADMDKAVGEVHRVLVRGGRAVFVVGDCTMRGVYIRNSNAVSAVGERHGLKVVRRRRRSLPPNRRYLPPPSAKHSGAMLSNRMRTEVLLELVKP